jgi:hypothetical protein
MCRPKTALKTAQLLDPAEHLLDAAPGVDRLGIALMASGAAIDGGATRASGVLDYVRCHADPSEVCNHSFVVVVLVGSERFPVGTGDFSRHRLGGIPLPGARRLCDAAVDDQGMAVVHEHVPPVAGQRQIGLGFPAQQGIRIDAGAMGLVAELDAAEVAFGPLPAGVGSTKALARA